MRIKIADKRPYALPGTNGRFWHLATIHYGIREFIYFIDKQNGITYIEEITGGTLNVINDDKLWNDLAQTLKENKLDLMGPKNE